MTICRHISTKLVLVLDAETAGGKKRKRVTVSNIREGVSADALRELAAALGKVLAHPVAQVLLYTEEALEREDMDGNAPKTDGISNEAAAEAVRTRTEDGAAPPAFAQRGNALSAEDAGARILPRGNKGQTSNASLSNGSRQPASTPCRRREPPFGRRGDPVQNPAAVYGIAILRAAAAVSCFLPSARPFFPATAAARAVPLVY